MQPPYSTCRKAMWGLAAIALLATCGLRGSAAPPAAKNDASAPLPKEIVEAWTKAGAEVGWTRVGDFQWLPFLHKEEGMAGDLPVFQFPAEPPSPWKEGLLARLPAPAAAFGLDFNATQITDTALKELVGFKNVQSLCLLGTPVTDEGLKKLANLKDLKALAQIGRAHV